MTRLLKISTMVLATLAIVGMLMPSMLMKLNTNTQNAPTLAVPDVPVTNITQMTAPDIKVEIEGSNLPTFTQQPLVDSKKSIRNLTLKPSRTLVLLGQVGQNALSLAEQISALNTSSSEPIYLLIDSPGGSVLTGAILISSMQASKAPVYTICYTLCASMAYMIHQYGTKRYAVDRAIFMSHPASVGYQGDVDRIQSFITMIQRYTNKLEVDVAKRRGLTFEQYKNRIAVEYWVDAEDALKDKVVDELVAITLQRNMLDSMIIDNKTNSKRSNQAFDVLWIWNGTGK